MADEEEVRDEVMDMQSVTKAQQNKGADMQSVRTGMSHVSKSSSQYIISNLEE